MFVQNISEVHMLTHFEQIDSAVATTISNAKEIFRSLGCFPAKRDGLPDTEAGAVDYLFFFIYSDIW